MKKNSLRLFLLLSILVYSIQAKAQQKFTRYDDLPGIHKSYKPAFEESFPDWAKMLYQYPVNYNELTTKFQTYRNQHHEEKNAIIRYYKMWSRVMEAYINESGEILLPETNETLSTHSKSARSVSDSKSNWTFLGPKETFWLNESGSDTPPSACPWQVNVYSFDVANSNENILFAGTETGFVNKSIDKGQNWTQVGWDHVFGGGITATVIHPQNPDIVYVAAGNQIHKTIDGGQNWTAVLPSGSTFSADRLRIDPLDPDKIVAATSTGVFISTDAGNTWTNRWSSATYDIEIQPVNSNAIFALSASGGNFVLAASSNGGLTFTAQNTFPTGISDASGGLLATTPNDPSIVLAVMLSANNTPLLYKGINTGMNTSWTLLATGQTGTFPMDNGQGYFDLILEISPINKNIIFAGTTTLFKSSNSGQNFSAIGGYSGNFAIHPDIQDMKLLENGETWVSTDGGMSLTTDNFTSTANYDAFNKNLIGSDMWGFDQGWNEDIVVGGRYHNGNTSIADFYGPKALRMGGAESPTGWVLQGKSRHVAFNDLGNGWILPATAEGIPEGRFIFSKYPNMEEYGGRRSNMVFHPNF
ncbi:MAG: WD40/YVTN/BNR-like repeat-containing protein, partial [Bacteroidales bacterium]